MARRYSQETVFGDWYDHLTDLVGYAGFSWISVKLVLAGASPWPLILTACAGLGAVWHMSCQELNSSFMQVQVLDKLQLCRRPEHAEFTRWLGVGTLNLAIVACILLYCRAFNSTEYIAI